VVTDVFVSEVDLHLKAGSPAIDAGDKALYAAALPDSDRDLEGGQRIYNGAGAAMLLQCRSNEATTIIFR